MEKIIVTRHSAVEKYIRGNNLVPKDTKCYPTVTKEFVKGKHVYGIVPFSIAAEAELFTEVKITIRKGVKSKELSLEELQGCVKEVQTYVVKKVLD